MLADEITPPGQLASDAVNAAEFMASSEFVGTPLTSGGVSAIATACADKTESASPLAVDTYGISVLLASCSSHLLFSHSFHPVAMCTGAW